MFIPPGVAGAADDGSSAEIAGVCAGSSGQPPAPQADAVADADACVEAEAVADADARVEAEADVVAAAGVEADVVADGLDALRVEVSRLAGAVPERADAEAVDGWLASLRRVEGAVAGL